jgi:cytochrome c-type biogenesis protein CcmH
MTWMVGGGLCVLSIAFVLWSAITRRGKRFSPVRHGDVTRAVYRSRLEEAAREIGDVDLLREINADLGAVLLNEEPILDSATDADTAEPVSRLALWVTAVSVPALAISLYLQVSDPYLSELEGAEIILTTSADEVAQLQSWGSRLAARVAQVPGDDRSWYLLGHAHLKLAEFADARRAFGAAHDLAGDDLNVMLYLLQARYLESRGMLDEVSRSLADKLLEMHPDFPVVLEMLALDAYRRGAYDRSVQYLHRAMTSTGDVGQQAVFATAISQVRGQMVESGPGIMVNVSTRAEVPATASIFVIARPAGGGMPYAVVKRAARAVPFTVRLDDLVSMSETHLLSAAQNVEVLVRLSHSGAPQADSGDWQWRSQPLAMKHSEQFELDAILQPP